MPKPISLMLGILLLSLSLQPLATTMSGTFFSAVLAPAEALTDNINLSESLTGASRLPQIATSGSDNIYIAWQDLSVAPSFEIFLANSTDGGETYGSPVRVTTTPAASENVQITASATSDTVHLIWTESNEIFYSNGTDGSAFGTPKNLSNDAAASASPQVEVSDLDGIIHVVWESGASPREIFYANSTDGGANFGTPENLSSNAGDSTKPQLAISDGGTIHVVWQDSTAGNGIIAASSVDNGATFSLAAVSTNPAATTSNPQIAISTDGKVYVVWQESVAGNIEIFVGSSTDDGETFTSVRATNNTGSSTNPRIAISDSGTVHIAWVDNSSGGNAETFYANSTEGGVSFGTPDNVSNNPGSSTNVRLGISGDDNVYIAWQDSNDIRFASSNDGGITFNFSINLSNNDGTSASSQTAVSEDGGVYVVWQDNDPDDAGGEDDILLQSNLDTNTPTVTLSVDETSLKWDIDSVEASGNVANEASGDTVTVYWGDGSSSSSIEISDSSWGPVSHTYSSSALTSNPNQIIAKLVSGGEEVTSSLPIGVDVQRHSTELKLKPIPSVKVGAGSVTLSGFLVDADMGGAGVSGGNITFIGAWEDGALPDSVLTSGGNGAFSSSGIPPSSVGSWDASASFLPADDSPYESSTSDSRIFDTASADSLEFAVSESDPSVAITHPTLNFNSSIQFTDIEADGTVYVSECSSTDARHISIERCLSISPGVQMAFGSSASVAISFAGATLPGGFTSNDIDLFHHDELIGDVVDVTSSRNATAVTGTVESFSEFVAGVAVHSDKLQGAHRQQIFVGDDNIVSLRDASDSSGSSVSAEFDADSYEIDEKPVLTIEDPEGNVDPSEVDIVVAGVRSNSSEQFFIVITLTETGANTGIFDGDFNLSETETSDLTDTLKVGTGDVLNVMYIPGIRFEAIVDGVTEAGLVEMRDVIVDTSACFRPVGGALSFGLIDAQLASDGNITVSISYANAQFLAGDTPDLLKVFQKVAGAWDDLASTVDTTTKTVTAKASVPGSFSLGYDVGCGGGAGGGLGRPGAGIVVDFVASIAKKPSPPQDTTGGSGGGASGGNRVVVVTNEPETQTFPESYFAENPLDRIQVMNVGFVNAAGATTFQTGVGEQINISSTFTNHQQVSQGYTFIVMIISEEGYTVDIALQDGSVESGQSTDISSSWMPKDDGVYSIKVFIWDGIGMNPMPLSEPSVKNIRIVAS